MPLPFQPDLLRTGLGALNANQPSSAQSLAYQAHYGLDFPSHKAPVHSRLGCFDVGGYQVVAQTWWPENPIGSLLLMHGFYDHMGLYRHVVRWALEMGFAVLSCDLPGHGLSSGARASIKDFAEYQSVLDGLLAEASTLGLPQPWHLCGQSTGGAIVIDHLLSHATSPAQGQAILLAPLVRPRGWGLSKLSYWLARPFVKSIPRTFSQNSGDAEFLAFLAADELQPHSLPTAWVGALVKWINRIEAAAPTRHSPLIVQGEADMTVDWRHNLSVLDNKFDRPQRLMLPTARHHLANESVGLRDEYFAFLRERLG